jgi:hypothetical protein
VQSWDELSESASAAGWDFGEDAEEDERDEPDNSDDEFEIRMDTDYSDTEMECPMRLRTTRKKLRWGKSNREW